MIRVTVYFRGGVEQCDAHTLFIPTSTGAVGVCSGHEPSIWRMQEGELYALHGDKKVLSKKVAGGVAYAYGNSVELSIDMPRA